MQLLSTQNLLGSEISKNSDAFQINFEAHSEPIRALSSWIPASLSPGKGNHNASPSGLCIVTGSKDHSIKLWRWTDGTLPSQLPLLSATLKGNSSIESLLSFPHQSNDSSSSSSMLLLGGDWNGCLRGWSLPIDLNLEGQTDSDNNNNNGHQKRRKTDRSSLLLSPSHEPQESFCIKAHSQTLSGMAAVSEQQLLSGSWDRSLKLWDLDRQDCVACFVCPKAVTSVHCRPHSNSRAAGEGGGTGEVAATSHPDGKVRLWDIRMGSGASEDRSLAVATFGKDSQWISQVNYSNDDSNTSIEYYL